MAILSRDHSFSTYGKFSKKVTFLIPYYAQLRVGIRGKGLEMFVFLENFANALNK